MRQLICRWGKPLLSAILAGILIGIGGTVYLSVDNPVAGAVLFGVGLFGILVLELHLFTGKVGYLPGKKAGYLAELVVVWLGNLAGTSLTAWMVRHSRIAPKLERVQSVVQAKLEDGVLSIFVLAVFCGILMYFGVDTFRSSANPVAQVAAVFIPVPVFILAGFEHVVANMYYFALAGSWSGKTLWYLLVMTAGNAAGSLLFSGYRFLFCRREG